MTRLLDHALTYAGLGVRVFPIQPNEKSPPSKFKWKDLATTDTAILTKWFGAGCVYQGHNLAAVMGEQLKDGGYSAAIDLDVRPKKNGLEAFMQFLRSEGIEGADRPDGPADAIKRKLWTDTWTQQTPSGGLHIIVRTLAPLRCKTGALVPNGGIDLKAKDGYILVAPSSINGNGYEILRQPQDGIGELPEALERRFAKWKAEPATPSEPKKQKAIDPQRAYNRGVRYLETAPIATEGQGGDATTYKVAAKLKDLGFKEEEALKLMDRHWNPRCEPPWQPAELMAKVRNAFRYGREPVGSAAPEAVFQAQTVEAQQAADSATDVHPLAGLNEHHALVLIGTSHAILYDRQKDDGARQMDFLGVETFRTLYCNVPFTDGAGKPRNIADAWLQWPGRRTYKGVIFSPERPVPAEQLNLWQGFGVKPVRGDWSKMRYHLQEVVCAGDQQTFAYVLGWMARAVQRPWENGHTAIVMRGRQGVGKSIVGNWMRRIFGAHGMQVTQPDHLTGKFNGHLKSCAFLFADEAFFAGDKGKLGVIKSVITEPTLVIELKGVDAFQSPNCLHVMLASNSQFVVPAGEDERRWCVLDVSDKYQQDRSYFGPLMQQVENGGLQAMLYDLLRHDLSDFVVMGVPKTKALSEQKLLSLRSEDKWLLELIEGEKLPHAWGDETWPEDKPLHLPKGGAYADYLEKCKSRYAERYPVTAQWFGRNLKARFGDAIKEHRPAGNEPREYVLPPLAEARRILFKAWGAADGLTDAGDMFD
jgi:hypothetical protein